MAREAASEHWGRVTEVTKWPSEIGFRSENAFTKQFFAF
jgi:hypothetical protein